MKGRVYIAGERVGWTNGWKGREKLLEGKWNEQEGGRMMVWTGREGRWEIKWRGRGSDV